LSYDYLQTIVPLVEICQAHHWGWGP